MRFLHIGVGGFGRVLGKTLKNYEHAEMVGLVDINDQALHKQDAVAAMRAGLDVISEKPMAAMKREESEAAAGPLQGANMKRKTIGRAVLALALAWGAREARAIPISGLTVAVSPDGRDVIAAGSNRVFYRLDPESLEVRERVWSGISITRMAFSRDGAVLAALDATSGHIVRLFDARTLREKAEVRGCEAVAFATGADVFAAVSGNGRDPAELVIYGLSDGVPRSRMPLTPRRRVVAIALNADATMAAALYDGQADPDEPRVAPDAALRGLDRAIAQQQGDGRTARIEFYDLRSQVRQAEHTLFYCTSGATQAVLCNGAMVVINYPNQNAVIGPDGSVRMFELPNSNNYGIGFSSDLTLVLAGGLAQFSVTRTDDLDARAVRVRHELPSWPEYFRGFAGHAGGPFYAGTDGYRVLKFDAEGRISAEQPIY